MGIDIGLAALGEGLFGTAAAGTEAAVGTGIASGIGEGLATAGTGLSLGEGLGVASGIGSIGESLFGSGTSGVEAALPPNASPISFGGPAAENVGSGFGDAFSGLGSSPAASSGVGTGVGSGTGTAESLAGKGSGNFWDSIVNSATSSITKNPLGTAAAGVGLGLNLFNGNPTNPNQAKLQASADQLGSQGQIFQQYLQNGTLPPALQAQMDQAKASARARIISNHAASGQSTDPSQNSALASELNSVDINAVSAMADQMLKMFQTGLSETGLSTQLYEMLVKMDQQNNKDLMASIASFASALGGGPQKKAA